MGPVACVDYPVGAGAPLRSGHGRGARLLPDRSRELSRRSEPRRVKRVVRRRALLVGVGLLVAVLVGGRWLALETAERAWGASVPGGGAYVTARDFARLVSGLLLIGGVAWGTANLLFVYRSIGSMQLSRRLGDLEIVEAVPQPLLLAGTIACGLVFGFLLTLGTGDWWMAAALASRPPTFGVTDTVLQQDLGYYLGQLPWTERLRGLALVAVCSATVVVALLYVGIGSLRFRRWLPYANARAHLGVLLALLALTLTWGAVLDPAETVAGLHGTLTRRTLDVRLAAAPIVAGVGAAVTLVSLVWGLRERPVLLVTAWSALVAASLLGFAIIPASLSSSLSGSRGRGTADPDTALAAERRRHEGLAFGITLTERPPPGWPSPEAAAAAVPMWDAQRVVAAAGSRRDLRPQSTPTAAGLLPRSFGDGRATWLWRSGPTSTASCSNSGRPTGPRSIAARRRGSGGRWRPWRTIRSSRSRRSRRATPLPGSARGSRNSRSRPRTPGRRCGTRESRWRGAGAEPRSRGPSRAPRWRAARPTAWCSCGDGTCWSGSGGSRRPPRSTKPFPSWPTAPCGGWRTGTSKGRRFPSPGRSTTAAAIRCGTCARASSAS